jgi:hypothetical protein
MRRPAKHTAAHAIGGGLPLCIAAKARAPRMADACLQVIKLKAALNEKEIELIELREQHMQLVVGHSVWQRGGRGRAAPATAPTQNRGAARRLGLPLDASASRG